MHEYIIVTVVPASVCDSSRRALSSFLHISLCPLLLLRSPCDTKLALARHGSVSESGLVSLEAHMSQNVA